jgi:hypothetical protein
VGSVLWWSAAPTEGLDLLVGRQRLCPVERLGQADGPLWLVQFQPADGQADLLVVGKKG